MILEKETSKEVDEGAFDVLADEFQDLFDRSQLQELGNYRECDRF